MPLQDSHEPRWLDYLFSRPSRAELGPWVRRLRYFRFCKALGGHANDGDQLLAVLRYTDAADLRQLFAQLGCPADIGSSADLPPSPGRVVLAGAQASVWISRGPEHRVEITVLDVANPYELTARAVVAAEAIEILLVALEPRIIDPPIADYHCVCPAYYPELWAEPGKQIR